MQGRALPGDSDDLAIRGVVHEEAGSGPCPGRRDRRRGRGLEARQRRSCRALSHRTGNDRDHRGKRHRARHAPAAAVRGCRDAGHRAVEGLARRHRTAGKEGRSARRDRPDAPRSQGQLHARDDQEPESAARRAAREPGAGDRAAEAGENLASTRRLPARTRWNRPPRREKPPPPRSMPSRPRSSNPNRR